MATGRVTITLPSELVEEIDRRETNRSRFVLEAVQRELQRRRRESLRHSLRRPHPESEQLAEAGVGEWAAGLPQEGMALVDIKSGTPIQWLPGKGWTRRRR